MGLFKWLKKELVPGNVNGHRRRESAPPLLTHILDANSTRDEAYMKALAKFNEWRNNQQTDRATNDTNLKKNQFIDTTIEEEDESTLEDEQEHRANVFVDGYQRNFEDDETEEDEYEDGNTQKHNININSKDFDDELSEFSSDLELTREEKEKLGKHLETPPVNNYVPKKPERSADFLQNKQRMLMHCRMSLPAPYTKIQLHKPQEDKEEAGRQEQSRIHEQEIEEFENMHCNKNSPGLSENVYRSSPPAKFYHKNQSPYRSRNNKMNDTSSPKYAEPYFEKTAPKSADKSYQRSAIFKRKSYRAPQPPVISNEEEPIENAETDKDSQQNESYKAHKNSSFSARLKRSPNQEKLPKIVKERRLSPPYQTIINKHGDLVEYALPYADHNLATIPYICSKKPSLRDSVIYIKEVDDEFDMKQSISTIDGNTEMSIDPITTFLERRARQQQVITDLDKSGESAHKFNPLISVQKDADVCEELDSLENWSNNIQLNSKALTTDSKIRSCLDHFQMSQNNLLVCWPNEIQFRNGLLKNSFSAPLDFSSGIFRNAPVTLRKFNLTNDKSLYHAEEASKRDFDILNHIKHTDIAILMAVSYDSGLNQTALLLEPFEFTLHFYLHQLNKKLSLIHCISVVQQIACATLYLQDCGYIHSNISSHNILMRTYPYCVKLSCFELTTEVSDETKREIEQAYNINMIYYREERNSKTYPEYLSIIKNSDEFIREKYIKLSKQTYADDKRSSFATISDTITDIIPAKYLPYNMEYRQKFSQYYYQAPELMKSKSNYVFPTQSTDVYSLTLLLWEVTNHCVPFIIFSNNELEKLFETKQAQLPNIEEERSKRFQQIFNYGLEITPSKRLIRIHKLIKMLDEIKLDIVKIGFNKSGSILNSFTIKDEDPNTERPKKKIINNNKEDLSTTDKNYHKENFYENTTTLVDSQKREENAITNENLDKMDITSSFTFSDADILRMTGMEKSSEIEPFFTSEISAIIDSDAVPRSIITNKKTIPTKPHRKYRDEANVASQKQVVRKDKSFGSSFSLSKSGIYQSLLDFNKYLSPKSKDSGEYERTSTIKKRKVVSAGNRDKKSAKELFEPTNSESESAKNYFDKMNKELDDLDANVSYSKDDFLSEIMNELQTRHMNDNELKPLLDRIEMQKPPAKESIKNNKSKFLRDILSSGESEKSKKNAHKKEIVKSCEHLVQAVPNKRLNKTVTNSSPSSYRFTIGDFYLPDTPIARKNKIRKNAWLSDQKLKDLASPKLKKRPNLNANAPVPHEDSNVKNSTVSLAKAPLKMETPNKKVNVSIKIIQNNVDVSDHSIYPDSLNSIISSPKMDNSTQGINIKVTPLKKGQRSIIKLNDSIIKTFDHQSPNSIEILDELELLNHTDISNLGNNKLEYSIPLENRNYNQSCKLAQPMSAETPEIISKQDLRAIENGRLFENSLWRREKSLCEGTLSPKRNYTMGSDADNEDSSIMSKSVREVIQQIETTFEKTGYDYSPTRKYVSNPKRNEINVVPINSTIEPTNVLIPIQIIPEKEEASQEEKPVNENDGKTSVTKLRIILTNKFKNMNATPKPPLDQTLLNGPQENTVQKIISTAFMPQSQLFQRRKGIAGNDSVLPKSIISGLDLSGVEQQKAGTQKKKLTRVTVNLRKLSSRRSSDAGQELMGKLQRHSANMEECAGGRHSICGNELLRSISQLALRDGSGASSTTTVCNKNDEETGLVAARGTDTRRNSIIELGELAKGSYVCCNCGTTMTPANVLKIPPGSTISIPSLSDLNITGSFCTSMVEDNVLLKDLEIPGTPLKRCQAFAAFHEAKSTEDLYIDDDFYQGIGANMELIQAMGSTDFLGSLDFDILSTEIYHDDTEDNTEDAKLQIVKYNNPPEQH